MFKNKEKRDTLLLVIMAIVILLFIIYLIIPFGKGEQKKSDIGSSGPEKTEENKTTTISQSKLEKSRNILDTFNGILENELTNIYDYLLTSAKTFELYPVKNLRKIIEEFMRLEDLKTGEQKFFNIITAFRKISFYDLPDIQKSEYPEGISKELRFNVYLSLILEKIREENIIEDFQGLIDKQFVRIIDFGFYGLIDNRVKKNFQLIPVIFFFKLFSERFSLFPRTNRAEFFMDKIADIEDLSSSQFLNKIRGLLTYSEEFRYFRINWIENDGIFSDDKKTYQDLYLKIFSFFKRAYLIFPDSGNREKNSWLEELIQSDSGNIELSKLEISCQDKNSFLSIRKIIYSPDRNFFMVVLKERPVSAQPDFIDKIVRKSEIGLYKKNNFRFVNFVDKEIKNETFKAELEKFGNYLKKLKNFN